MKKIIKISKTIIIGTLILWILPSIFLIKVAPDTIGVRQSNISGVLEEDLGPGWHWRIPGIHKITMLSRSYTFLDYTTDNVGPQESLEIRTSDNNIVHLDVSVPVRIKKGEAYKIVMSGNHATDTNGKFRYIRLAQDATISVLRDQLAKLSSSHFYNTSKRLSQARITSSKLNESLKDLNLEAESVLIRAVRYRKEYEKQLQHVIDYDS